MKDHEQGWDAVEEMRRGRYRARLLGSLIYFVEQAWPIVEPGTAFVGNWHLNEICRTLEQVEADEIERAIINQPPGTCKTRLLLFWAAHLLAKDPRRRILIATYGRDLSGKFAGDIRTLLRSEWYQTLFPIRFKADQDEKSYFATIDGGWCLATSIEGQGQGLHPDYIILDDPLKALDAMTVAGRDGVWNWFKNTLTTRGMTRRVRVVASGQRLDRDDFFGRLMDSATGDTWTHRCFPMRYNKARPPSDTEPNGYVPDPHDPRTEEDELLWPALVPLAKVLEKEAELQEDAPAQFQQQPSVKGGRLFKVDQFQFYDVLPPIMKLVRAWDTGGTEGGGDPSVGVLMGQEIQELVTNGVRTMTALDKFYVLDVKLEHVGPENLGKLIRSTAESDGIEATVRWEREGGSSGVWMSRDIERILVGYDAAEVLPGTNKVIRSKPYRAQVNQGHVFLPRGAKWVAAYIKELADFPSGVHDDQVDASSCAFNVVLLEEIQEDSECTF